MIIIYSLLIVAILFFLGFGITHLILPNEAKKYSFWLIPWFGIIFSILFLVILSFLGVPVKISALLLIFLIIVINLFVLIRHKKLIHFGDLKENLVILLLIGGSIFFVLQPLIKISNFPTTISLGNNDISAYIEGADYLINNSVQKAFYSPTSLGVKDIILGSFRYGPIILYSFFSFILGLKPYEISYILQASIFPLTAPLIYIFIKIIYKKTYIGLLLSFFITVFNVNLLYMLYHNFFPHTIFRGLTYFLLLFFLLYSHDLKKRKDGDFINNYDLIISICLSAAFFSYQEAMSVFIVLPLCMYTVIISLLKKNIFYIDKMLKIILITSVTSLLSVIYSFRFLFYLFSVANKNEVIGWQLFRSKIPYANPFEALGFYSIHQFPPLPNLIAISLSVLVIAIIIFGIYKSKHKIFLTIFLTFYLLILIRSWFVTPNFFDYSRALSYTLPLFIILFSIGFSYLFEKHKKVGTIFLVIIISLEFFSAYKLNLRFIQEGLSVNKEYASLKNIQTDKKIVNEHLYLENDINPNIPLWNYIWSQYFLNLNKFPINSEVTKNNKKITVTENSLVLIHTQNTYPYKLKIFLNNIIWENDFYRIGHLCTTDQCLLNATEDLSKIIFGKTSFDDSLLISGWSVSEPESRWSEGKYSNLRLVNKIGEKSKIIIEASTLKEPQNVNISIDNELIGSFSPSKEFKIFNISLNNPLSMGVHRIIFTFSNSYKPSEIYKSADNRELSVNFKQIKLE